MARYLDAIDVPLPPERVFDDLADFGRTAEWDPGVVEASRLTWGPIGPGSRFRIVVDLLGRRLPLVYRIVEYRRPIRLVLEGGDGSVRAVDEISFSPRPGGTRVTYEARIELKGGEGRLDRLLQRIGSLAVRGLRERLASEGSAERPQAAPRTPAATVPRRAKAARARRTGIGAQKGGLR